MKWVSELSGQNTTDYLPQLCSLSVGDHTAITKRFLMLGCFKSLIRLLDRNRPQDHPHRWRHCSTKVRSYSESYTTLMGFHHCAVIDHH
jgi:hypothetical protein